MRVLVFCDIPVKRFARAYVNACARVCVCVCVCEREGERERVVADTTSTTASQLMLSYMNALGVVM